MSRLGPGSLLATQRYAVRERLAAAPGWERWDCHDTTLDRPVVAVTFPAGAPDAAAAIDVARRAASLEDPRLVRILDVVVQDDVAAIIEEPLPQARSLTRIIHDGPLPSEEARRIIGEAATALASAEARGLHHHLVSPDAIRVLADGGVKVRGLSYEAALAGIDIDDGRAGSLRDAQGLCSCLYAALAARWPLRTPPTAVSSTTTPTSTTPATGAGFTTAPFGLDLAPRVGDRFVAPGEIEAGVDAELDELCLVSLANPDREAVGAPGTAAEVVAALRPWSPTPVVDLAVVRPGAQSLGPVAEDDLPPVTPSPERASSPSADRGIVSAGGVAPANAAVGSASVGSAAVGGTAVGSAAVGGTAVGSAAASDTAYRGRSDGWDDYLDDLEETPISEVLADSGEYYSPSTQFGAGSAGRPERKLALLIVGGLVLLLAILGYCGAPKLSPSDLGLSQPARSTLVTAKPTKAAGSSGATTPGATSSPAAGGEATLTPVAVIGGAGFEPQNGGQVANKTAARAYDGDLTTMWQSNKWYATEKFGGLNIPGTGLILDLGQSTPVRQVTLTLPVPQDITVYVANAATTEGATAIGSKVAASGAVVFDAPTPLEGDLVIVYVTKLGPDNAGHFRALVSEVQVLR